MGLIKELRREWLFAGLLATVGCYDGAGGEGADGSGTADGGSDGDGDGVGDGPAEEACDPDGPSVTDLKRLSALQYRNTLADLFANAPGAAPVVEQALLDLPLDEADDRSFAAMDLRLTQRHINTFYAVADTVGNAALDDPSMMEAIAGECSTATDLDATCLEDFVRDFGLKVYRRPLDDEDIALYLSLPEADRTGPESFRDVLFAMLMSPGFHYHFETEGSGDDVMAIDGYEIASRLSFHFWQSMPDDTLLAAAADGSLQTEEGYEAAVERMVNGDGRPRTEETVAHFYREWLHIENLGSFVDTPAFNAFSEGVAADETLVEAMVDEIDALTHYFTFETSGRFADLITSDISVTNNATLAALYGVSPNNGAPDSVRFADGERAGILTRAAMLYSGDEKTNPIFRGIDVRERLLCLELALPDPTSLPPDAFDPPPIDPQQSTRQRYDAKTAADECQACHTQINPIGYIQEAYDALGRFRTTELIYDDSGLLIGEQPVDTAVTIDGLADTQLSFDGPPELMEWLADDPRVQRCFAQHYFQYTFRRDPTPNDSCVVENLEGVLDSEGILVALAEIALQPEFRLRKVGE